MSTELQKFLLSNVYIGIYLMSYFEESWLNEMKNCSAYKKLFTRRLETDLYRERLKRFGIDHKKFVDLEQLKRNSSWSEVYEILCFFKRNRDWDYFLRDTFMKDNILALRMIEYFYESIKLDIKLVLSNLYKSCEYKPRRICRYLIRNNMVIAEDWVDFCNMIIDGQWNDD